MNDTDAGGSQMGSFLLGAAVGAGVAMLLAPASGRETRRVIGDRARDLGGTAQDKLEHLREGATYSIRGVKVAVREGMEAFRREADPSPGTSDAP